MLRSIETWQRCSPSHMASQQSRAAIEHALRDMRADILALHRALDDMIRITGLARDLVPGARDALIAAADQYRPLLARV